MNVIRNPTVDPMWDDLGLTSTDFRPHWNGNLVNVFSGILPSPTKAETQDRAIRYSREIAAWLVNHRDEFGAEDRFQLIVFFPLSVRRYGRQIVKIPGDMDAMIKIANGSSEVALRPMWDHGLFQETSTAANRSQPVGPQANGTSSAAGSGG